MKGAGEEALGEVPHSLWDTGGFRGDSARGEGCTCYLREISWETRNYSFSISALALLLNSSDNIV